MFQQRRRTALFFQVVAIVLLLRLVTAAVPSGYPACAASCVDKSCPMQDLDCICTNVTSIGVCIGSNCSNPDATSAAPFIGFCCTVHFRRKCLTVDLSGTPTFGSQTATPSSTGPAAASARTTQTGSVGSSGSRSVGSTSSTTNTIPSGSAAGSIVGGNGFLVGLLAMMVGIALSSGTCRPMLVSS
jgi:CFEM domain